MRKALTSIRMTAVTIRNILVFLSCAIPRGIPVRRWPYAYRKVQELHEREVRQMLTELTMTGKVKRRIEDGHFIYFPMDED